MYSKRDDVKEDEVYNLRAENALIYLRPSNTALVDRRTFKSYNFSSTTYELGGTMQAIFNSGGDAIWGRTSYLRIQYTSNAALDFASGCILNIFKSVRLTHRSGEILEFIDNVNVLANQARWWRYSLEDRKKLDGMLGVVASQSGAANIPGAGVASHVACVPLSLLLGFFNSESQMIPAAALAGAKLEVELAPQTTVSIAGTLTAITPTIVLDSSQLYDSVGKQLIEEQADVNQSGIQFHYQTYFNTYATTTSNTINIDVQQSASLTEHILVCPRLVASIGAQGATLVATGSFNFIQPFTQAQFRLGSQYYPQQPINTPGATNLAVQKNSTEWYALSLVAWNGYPDQYHKAAGGDTGLGFQADSVLASNAGGATTPLNLGNSYAGTTNGTTVDTIFTGQAMLAMTLEKSSCGIAMSGEPTNNSRILNFNGTLAVAEAAGVRCDVFLGYLRVANLMGDNCIVDR